MTPLLDTLKALEVSLHDPGVRADARRVAALLHPAFREFGRSGGCYSRSEIVAHLSDQPLQPSIWTQDFALDVLADGLALLTYRSAHLDEHGALQRHTLRSSLWQRSGAGWQMRFHQGTPTVPFEKHSV